MNNVQLDCGHSATFNPPPHMHDIIYCRKCCSYRIVIGGILLGNKAARVSREYKFRAICRQCRFKGYKNYDHSCLAAAEKHATKFGHTVDVVTRDWKYVGTRSKAVTDS